MYKYDPGEVYKTLPEFLKTRKIESGYAFLPIDKFSEVLNSYEYVRIDGQRVDSRGTSMNVFIFLIMPNSRYTLRTPDFKKLFNLIPKAKLTENTEIMFISERPLTKLIKKTIEEDLRPEHRTVYFEDYDYSKFYFVVPNHPTVQKHEIANKAEFEKWCKDYGTAKEDLKKIYVTDPPVVWLGAKPGDVIKIHRNSESAGHAIDYRQVIPGGY